MFFTHPVGAGRYAIPANAVAAAHPALCHPIFAEFFENFTFGVSRLAAREESALSFRLGESPAPAAPGRGYAISVTPDGAAVAAGNEKELIRGVLTLFDMISMDGAGAVYLPCCAFTEVSPVALRMVHLCLFPETELRDLQRWLRLAAALKYTHMIVEFWGTLRFSCLPELGWKDMYTAEDLRPLMEEAQALGLEVVPMFNHWGHASGCRVVRGKHVVLDQNPALQYLFDDTGWCWKWQSEKVRRILAAVRAELIALCGKGEYFHIGCDEAYGFCPEHATEVCRYINETAEELRAMGRKTILWGDMLISPEDARDGRFASAKDPATPAAMRQTLSKDLLVADWQYDVKTAPVPTAPTLRDAGFPVLLCPWDRSAENVDAVLRTVKDEGLAGVLHTTWHTIDTGLPRMGRTATWCWGDASSMDKNDDRTRMAALLRRVSPARGEYSHSGFSRSGL